MSIARKLQRKVQRKLQRLFPLRAPPVTPDWTTDLGALAILPDGFYPTNPSIAAVNDGYVVCIRGVNYVLDGNGRMLPPRGGALRSINRFILVDRSFTLVRALSRLDDLFEGIEDVRLIRFGRKLLGFGSVQVEGKGAYSNRMMLLDIAPSLDSGEARPLASPYSFPREKNWSPFIQGDDLYILYAFGPLILLRLDPDTGELSFCDPACARFRPDEIPFLIGGSSAGVAQPEGTIFIAHRRRVSLPRLDRSYCSRVYRLSTDLRRLSGGPFFCIDRAEVQFVNGCLMADEQILLSFGRRDNAALLCGFDARAFMARLGPQA
jgi:hypothetical protein